MARASYKNADKKLVDEEELHEEIEYEVKKEIKRDWIQHAVYALVIFSVVVGIVFYENTVTAETRKMLLNEIAGLQQELSEVKGTLTSRIGIIEQDVSSLDSLVVKSGKEIEGLTGELGELKIESQKQLSSLEEQISGLKSEFKDFSEVIDEVLPSVVSVKTNIGVGSGFIIDSGGYIVTNYHVINGASAASVITSEGGAYAVSLVGTDINADIALLKIDASGLKKLSFGNSDNVKVGEKVIAVGNPGGLDFSVTQGIVSAVNREDSRGNLYIQIDVPINPGNSGGPLINTEGQVIGVNTLKLAGFEGVGFALASNNVEDVVDDLKS